jgi:hypothetical protein
MDIFKMPTLYEFHEKAYLDTSDAHHVWEAMRLITKYNEEFPEWIREYLANLSEELVKLDVATQDFPHNVVNLLGLTKEKRSEYQYSNSIKNEIQFYRNSPTDHNAMCAYSRIFNSGNLPPNDLITHISLILGKKAKTYEAKHPTYTDSDVQMAKLWDELEEAGYGKKRKILEKYAAEMEIEVAPASVSEPADILEERLKRFKRKSKKQLKGFI